ncbi:tyrosine-type recombinase/integrase [Streptomyces sp. NPDC004237]|uniref:tyrosine-type recombinase/integrase n=1 Tax=Streptomyces sp. NPDC004237 TaxID=3154455 RepID=UPI0033BE0079
MTITHGDWVWALCEAGADVVLDDWDSAYIFCNLHRGRRFAPLRPESVYRHLGVMTRRLGLPEGMTPHWYRHTHATALLLAGVPEHVVSRRLGHADIQTTINTYANSRELHQMGEKPQVARSGQRPARTLCSCNLAA